MNASINRYLGALAGIFLSTVVTCAGQDEIDVRLVTSNQTISAAPFVFRHIQGAQVGFDNSDRPLTEPTNSSAYTRMLFRYDFETPFLSTMSNPLNNDKTSGEIEFYAASQDGSDVVLSNASLRVVFLEGPDTLRTYIMGAFIQGVNIGETNDWFIRTNLLDIPADGEGRRWIPLPPIITVPANNRTFGYFEIDPLFNRPPVFNAIKYRTTTRGIAEVTLEGKVWPGTSVGVHEATSLDGQFTELPQSRRYIPLPPNPSDNPANPRIEYWTLDAPQDTQRFYRLGQIR